MISMIRATAKFFIVVAPVAACLPTTSSYATDIVAYASSPGSGSSCTVTQPCAILDAISVAIAPGSGLGRVICLSLAEVSPNTGIAIIGNNQTLEIDCPGGFLQNLQFSGPNSGRLLGLTFTKGFSNAIQFGGSGTLILENCAFVDETSIALDIEPNGPLNLVIGNSRILNSGAGILLKPGAGGSIKATLDHVTITGNSGGGIKSDSTNGVVNLVISDSEISNNGGNGINLVGSANQNMLNLSRTVIAKNGVAGLQANGATTAALVDTTLFDTNTSGATSVLGGGHVPTYGNNRIVGSAGTGFTGPTPLQ
jgi:Right handed beta helix region